MWKKVDNYSLYWSAEKKAGTIFLKLSDGTNGEIKHFSKMELTAFAGLLRNEETVWFHTTRGDLSTETTPIDEEERD